MIPQNPKILIIQQNKTRKAASLRIQSQAINVIARLKPINENPKDDINFSTNLSPKGSIKRNLKKNTLNCRFKKR